MMALRKVKEIETQFFEQSAQWKNRPFANYPLFLPIPAKLTFKEKIPIAKQFSSCNKKNIWNTDYLERKFGENWSILMLY